MTGPSIKQIRNTVAKQSMVTVTYVHLVGERWLIKKSSGKIARGESREVAGGDAAVIDRATKPNIVNYKAAREIS